jgi:hypothetical protein
LWSYSAPGDRLMKVTCPKLVIFLFVIAGFPLSGRGKDNNSQTPRQALIEMLSGNPEKLNRHLTLPVQEQFKALLRNAPAGTPNPIQAVAIAVVSNGKPSDAFDIGPILFSINNPETNQRVELHVDSDEFRGEEDEMEISVHSFRAGVEERMPVRMRFLLSMKLQQEIWRLDAITVSAKLPIGDPHMFDKSVWMPQLLAGSPSDLGTVLAGDPAKPKITPLRAVRRMALAENIYAQKHPDMGFTCAISNLVNIGHGLDEGEPFKFVDPEFTGGVYNGYRFAIRGCDGKPSKSFQVLAEPISGKGKAYCSDDRLNLRAADDGHGSTCLASGRIARN